jgi:DNA end-binding protein Ku
LRSIWSGAISLSLLNVPVKLGSATQDNHLGLRMVRKSDGSRIKFTRVSETDGKEVPWHEIVKGYDAPDGSLVLLEKKDFQEAYGEKNRVAKLIMFADAADVPPMAARSAYWVQADKGGEKTYALLASALQATGKVAILAFAMREREAMAVLRPVDGYLSLEALEWDADLLRPDFAAPANTATAAEQELALTLIETMSGKYDHAAQTDSSAEAVMAVIQGKIERGEVRPAPAAPNAATGPADLMAVLQAAVAAKKAEAPAEPAPTARKRATPARKAS